MCAKTHCVAIRRQLVEISSLLLPYGSWGLNSGCLACQQVLLLSQSSHQFPSFDHCGKEQLLIYKLFSFLKIAFQNAIHIS